MTHDEWTVYGIFPNSAEAEVIKSLLEPEGVPTNIEPFDPIKGVRLLVNAGLVHRAQWIIRSAGVTDAELLFLATGEFPGQRDSSDL